MRTSGVIEWLERLATRAKRRRLATWLDGWGNQRFSRKLAEEFDSAAPYAIWGYNGSSLGAFEAARKMGRYCILDRTIGDFSQFNVIMAAVREHYGEWFLPTEAAVSKDSIDRDHREYELADRILVGSEFVARTIRAGVGGKEVDSKITQLDYCFDERLFGGLASPLPVARERPVRFLFMGLVSPRKGIQHVLEAIARIPDSAAELTVVGDMRIPPKVFSRYLDRITYIPTVARADVPRIMSQHDVLVLPSYFEGAALVLYEALAAGCALIQSRNCSEIATSDTGILLDEIDTDSVLSAMLAVIEDRDRLDFWRSNAQGSAQAFTFARYTENIASLLDKWGI